MTKISNLSSPRSFFQAQNAPKSVFAPNPAGGAYDALPEPLVGWEGDTPPHSPKRSTPSASRTRRLRRLGSQPPSTSAPSTQNPGYASVRSMVDIMST